MTKDQMLWPLQRFILTYSSKHFCFFSIFRSIWHGEKNNTEQRNMKWNPRVAFHMASRLNQSFYTLWTMRFPGKHLLHLMLSSCIDQIISFHFVDNWEGIESKRHIVQYHDIDSVNVTDQIWSFLYSCSCVYNPFTVRAWTGVVFECML